MALKTSDVVAARAMAPIICRYQHTSSQKNLASRVLIGPGYEVLAAALLCRFDHPGPLASNHY
jgi:hypothetical protein